MELTQIIEKLEKFNPYFFSKVEEPAYIQTHKMLEPNQTHFFSECLYVGYVSYLPELPKEICQDTICNVICIKDKPLPQNFKPFFNLNLLLVEKEINQFDVLNNIADILIDEAKLIASMKQLLDALYDNQGIQHIVDVATETFENPIFINDMAYKIIAMSHKTVFNDPTLEDEKTLGYIHEENLSAMRRDMLMNRLSGHNYPIYSKNNDMGWLMRSIRLHGIEVGTVALAEHNRPFRKIDYELLNRFSKLVAIEMEKSTFYKDNKGIMYNYFLVDLIVGKVNNPKAIRQRLSSLNWKIERYFQMLLIIDHNQNDYERNPEGISRELKTIIPDCHWAVYHNNLAVIINRQNHEILTLEEQLRIKEFFVANNLSCGISDVYSNIVETSRHYNQAMHAVELGIFINHKNGIYHYSDYMIAYIGQILSKHNDLQNFSIPAINVIQKFDTENKSQLLETLKQYLYYVNNPVAAAESLHIHRNTLLYRINKIKEITNLDLDNGDERLKIQLYLKFMDFMKGSW